MRVKERHLKLQMGGALKHGAALSYALAVTIKPAQYSSATSLYCFNCNN
jgi:hypothetical protein